MPSVAYESSSFEDILPLVIGLDGSDTDMFYELSKNEELNQSSDNLSFIFMLFHQRYGGSFLVECIYSWLDGWSDHWSFDPSSTNVRIRGENVVRKICTPRLKSEIGRMFRTILPLLGETELYHFYKSQLQSEFEVEI
jgi:hypothetical protein